MEASGGIVLVSAAALALLWANSRMAGLYQDVWHTELRLGVGQFVIAEDLQHWVTTP